MSEATPDENVEHFEIQLTPEAVAFYKAIHQAVNDPRLRTQDLLVQLDQQITEIFDAGFPTSDITEVLDELWDHLKEQGATLPVSEERLKEIRGE